MKVFVDIDETICFYESKEQRLGYRNAIPHLDNISKINKLYESGNTIVYWTARGTGSGKDYSKLTEDQLRKSGAKFHNLLMGKPVYDLFIDDKNINSETYFGS